MHVYVVLWVSNFALSLPATILSNGFFSVPLYQVVNVNLSITLFVVYCFVVVCVVAFFVLALTGRFLGAIGVAIAAILALTVPFSSIAAYEFYAYLGGINEKLASAETGFVYYEYLEFLRNVWGTVFPDINTVAIYATVASFILALIVYLNRASERRAG